MISKNLMAASAALIASPAVAGNPPNTLPVVPAAASSTGTQQPTPLTEAERAQAIQELQDLKARMSALENRLGVTPEVQVTPRASRNDPRITISNSTVSSSSMRSRTSSASIRIGTRPFGRRASQPAGRSSAATASRSSASASRGSAPRRRGMLAEQALRGEVRVRPVRHRRRRRPDDIPRPPHVRQAGDRSSPARPTRCSWTATSSPTSIDYWGPPGMVFVRNPQIRWTFFDRDGLDRGGRARASQRRHRPGQYPPDRREYRRRTSSRTRKLPDLTAAVRYGGDWGHVRLAGILRKVGYDTRGTDGQRAARAKRPAGASTRRPRSSSGLATLRLGVVYGRGIATYMNDGGMDLAPAVSTVCRSAERHPSSRGPRP